MNAEGMYNASYNDVSSSGKQFQNNLDTMYFDETYGQGVRDNFNLYGGAKANQAAANAAAANGGNFDSFADYNKNLTDMSYRIAGENAVQKMREGYANDYTNFLNVWGNQLMGNAKNFGDYEYDNRQLESNERIAKAQNDKDIYAIDKGYDAEVYGYDTQKDISKAQNETDITITGMNNEAQLAITGISKDTEIAIANIQAETEKHGYDSAERIAAIQDATSRYIADLDAKLRQGEIDLNRYIAELQHASDIYGIDAQKYIAEVQAAADKVGYNTQAYIAKMNNNTAPKYTYTSTVSPKTGTTSSDTEIKPTGVSDVEIKADGSGTKENPALPYLREDGSYGQLTKNEVADLDIYTRGGQNPFNRNPAGMGFSEKGKMAYESVDELYKTSGESVAKDEARNKIISLRNEGNYRDADILEIIFFGAR
jgi:hypothetical protein